ncbi:MAG: EscD/YscD/HrpQ family type III secretion system inner membrane ring protein [Verrucomicrobia bacterium]|nr:MAG: EscD/YscD/HrpQ family type III secretion system inner membrane ring protein [Verrucomicrobiota bacterium]
MESQFIVKVLDGPHQGAQMEVSKEGIVLGSDDACDLIIFDPNVAPRHLQVLPQENGSVSLIPLEGEVALNGLPINEKAVINSPTQVITAGSTHFVVGLANQEWPEVTIPESTQTNHEPDEQISVELATQNVSASTEAGEVGTDKKTKNILPRVLIGSSAIILVGAGAFFAYELIAKKLQKPGPITTVVGLPSEKSVSFWERISPKKTSIVRTATAQPSLALEKTKTLKWPTQPVEVRVTQALFENVPGVLFSINSEAKRKQFNVWVRGEAAVAVARRILDQASPPLTYNLIDLSQLETSATTLAQLYGLSLHLRIEPEGIAFWSGYLKDDKNFKDFFSQISRDLPTIRDNRSEIIFGSQLIPKLLKEIQDQGFSDVRPVATEEGIRIEGYLQKDQMEKWKHWMTELRGKYTSLAFISDQVGSGTPTNITLKEFFPSQVIGIAGSIMPWVSLADGTKLFPGAKLKKGYTLEAITSDSLRLTGPEGPRKFTFTTLNN